MATARDIRIPADAILSLHRSLARTVGAEQATRAMQEAGSTAGDRLHASFAGDGDDLGDVPENTFWTLVGERFRELGWGTVEHAAPHAGVGALVARDWFEAGEEYRGCPFTTGVLANLLGRAAGGDVAVLQVPCEDGSPGCVRFLFGAPAVLDRLYSQVRDGADVADGIAALG